MPIDTYRLWNADTPPALLASRHHATGEWLFPALPDHSPLASRHATVAVQGIGTVYSFTIIHPAPKTGQPSYALGYVDFDGPVRLFGRLQGKDRPTIGERYVPQPDDTYGFVFHALQD